MNKTVLYDFTDAPAPGSVVDGSDEMLPAGERVTVSDLSAPLAGGFRDLQISSGEWPPRRPAHWGPAPAEQAPKKDAAE